MKEFRFDATILQPPALSPDARESFRAALERAEDASDRLRVNEDAEGRVTVSFRLEASNERQALTRGSEITLAALERHATIRWVSSGVTHWVRG